MNTTLEQMIKDVEQAQDLIYKTRTQAIKNGWQELIPMLENANDDIKESLDFLRE